MSRTAYQVPVRILRNGGRVNSESYRGTADDSWKNGNILSLDTGRPKKLTGTIDDNITAPVRFMAMSTCAGDSSYVPVQEINADTVLEAQVAAGSADVDDIGTRATLLVDATTGNTAVNLAASADYSIEIIDVEPNFDPSAPDRAGNYNKVWFRFLPVVLDL